MNIQEFIELTKQEAMELTPCRNGRLNRPSCNIYHYKITYRGQHVVYFLTLKQIYKSINIPPSSTRKLINNMNVPKWKHYNVEKVHIKVSDVED